MLLLPNAADDATDFDILISGRQRDALRVSEKLHSPIERCRCLSPGDTSDARLCGVGLALAGSGLKREGLSRKLPGWVVLGQAPLEPLDLMRGSPCSP